MKKARRDIAQEITDAILNQLSKGVIPWQQSWKASTSLPLRHNGQPYNGINVLMLFCTAIEAGYSSPFWMTFAQAKALGGKVRKGERSTPVVYYGVAGGSKSSDTSEESTQEAQPVRRFLRSYPVFNADQIEGLPGRFSPAFEGSAHTDYDSTIQRLLEEMTAGLDLSGGYSETGNIACYRPRLDAIQMPPRTAFDNYCEYAITRAHEMTHATQSAKRLDIDYSDPQKKKKWGDEGYALGELFAELAAAFTGAHLGVQGDYIPASAAYIDNWMTVLKKDKNALLKVSGDAQRAVDYLFKLTSTGSPALSRAKENAEVTAA